MPNVGIQTEPAQLRDGALAYVAAAAEPLPHPLDPAFAKSFDRFGAARVVLLGASCEGVAEFQQARAAITRWLIERRGFNVVAIAADWAETPSSGPASRRPAAKPALAGAREPHGRGAEFETFWRWLVDHNGRKPDVDRVMLHGLDVYGSDSAEREAGAVLARLDADCARIVRARFGHKTPWSQEGLGASHAVSGRYARSEGAVTSALKDSLRRRFAEHALNDAVLSPQHVSRLIQNAETYYRAQYYGGADGWSARSAHLCETLEAVMRARGPDARAVVWAHNAQVGDAAATEMGAVRDEHSLGQLCRKRFGEAAVRIGFAGGVGTFACRDGFGGERQVQTLKPPLPASHEALSGAVGKDRFLLDLRSGVHSSLRRALAEPRLERFIGETYDPDHERARHYAECRLPEQFDAWVWFNQTTATQPASA
jgi:erythromycin esterase-like protein